MKMRHPQSMNIYYNIGYALSRWLATVFFSYRVEGVANIPTDGPVILAANHTSFFDPPLVGIASKRAMWFLARKSLLDWPVLGPIFPSLNVIPVDRDGNDRSALKNIMRLLEEGEGVILFPEGTRSPDGRLQKAQPGLGMIVAKTLAPVVPARVFGAYDVFPKGAKGIRPGQIAVSFGQPLYFNSQEHGQATRENYQAISAAVVEAIGRIPRPAGYQAG